MEYVAEQWEMNLLEKKSQAGKTTKEQEADRDRDAVWQCSLMPSKQQVLPPNTPGKVQKLKTAIMSSATANRNIGLSLRGQSTTALCLDFLLLAASQWSVPLVLERKHPVPVGMEPTKRTWS
ncbi:Hypothetical predicted protein [Marmota monax]|uniref:Uncharacterized protein n=1 Tax=Marmota monax TaxID=9995 RepID=A0A5E4BTX4_MARMO|nr:hypothetical protein GHT09_017291 [Marmota monax]VTJ72746.1 Hypothetical predicted protein [Marmota monax]